MAAEPGPDPGPNPFSFHEFVRSQARGAQGGLLPAPGDEEEQEEDEEEEWGGSYRPCAVERAHLAAGPFCEGPFGEPPQPGYEEVRAASSLHEFVISHKQRLANYTDCLLPRFCALQG